MLLGASADGTALRVEVIDTGPGIAVEKRQRLFLNFARLDPDTADKVEGAGLGLALSARLAGLMGGKLGHDDNPGGGSVFWLELPWNGAATRSGPVSPSPSEEPDASLANAEVRPLRVLVVDDAPMNRDIAGSFLRAGGHEVTTVDGGAIAIAAVMSSDFDVVLMDVRMPGMDGLEATRRIRALPGPRGQVPIVALTAQAFADQIAECRKAGMGDHLSKPFTPDALNATVSRVAAAARTKTETVVATLPVAPATIPMGGEWPVLDAVAFERTARFLASDAVASYLQTISELGETLLEGLRKSEAPAGTAGHLADEAHTLAGSASMFGFERLAVLCRRYEAAISSGAENTELADGLVVAMEATLLAIRDRSELIAQA